MIYFNEMQFRFLSISSAKCPLKPKDFSGVLWMRIQPLRINYVQELIMRFKDYF